MEALNTKTSKEVQQLTYDLEKAVASLQDAGLTVLAFASDGSNSLTIHIQKPPSDFKLNNGGILCMARQVNVRNIDQEEKLVVANHRDFANISVAWLASSKPVTATLH